MAKDNRQLILQCRCANQLYSIDINRIERIIRMVKLQTLPGSADYFSGLLNLHGESIPVIDLAKRLETGKASEQSPDTPIIICNHDDSKLGLIVDEVLDMEKAQEKNEQSLENSENNMPIHAAVHNKKGDSLLIDIDKLIDENQAEHNQKT
jgi:purine-binding chemotaxis protein CheW